MSAVFGSARAYPVAMFRSVGALGGDAIAIVVFVAIGLAQHGEPLSLANLLWVAWPFIAGMLLGHLAIRSWRRPFGIWPQGVFIWAITVVAGMALRTLLAMGTAPAFVAVTAVVTAVLMLGWRAVALYVTRAERTHRSAADSSTNGSNA